MGDRLRVVERFVNDADRKLVEVESAIVNGEDILDSTPRAHRRALRLWTSHDLELFIATERDEATTEPERRRVERLEQKYVKASYGKLAKWPKGRLALSLVRDWHAVERLLTQRANGKNGADLTPKVWGIFNPIMRALVANDDEFFRALAEAIDFRKTRVREPHAEEADLRTRLCEYAILHGKKPLLTSYELREKFEPGYAGDIKNFQKILDECGVAWIRTPRGGPGKPRARAVKGVRREK